MWMTRCWEGYKNINGNETFFQVQKISGVSRKDVCCTVCVKSDNEAQGTSNFYRLEGLDGKSGLLLKIKDRQGRVVAEVRITYNLINYKLFDVN